MDRSMNTTSGRNRAAASTTCDPSSHSPTTTRSSSSDSTSANVWRTSGWSSTRSTRMPAEAPSAQLSSLTAAPIGSGIRSGQAELVGVAADHLEHLEPRRLPVVVAGALPGRAVELSGAQRGRRPPPEHRAVLAGPHLVPDARLDAELVAGSRGERLVPAPHLQAAGQDGEPLGLRGVQVPRGLGTVRRIGR